MVDAFFYKYHVQITAMVIRLATYRQLCTYWNKIEIYYYIQVKEMVIRIYALWSERVIIGQWSIFAISWQEQVTFWCDYDDDVCFVLDQHTEQDFYSDSSLKQQSAGRHVAPLGHIILILNQPVFALNICLLVCMRVK